MKKTLNLHNDVSAVGLLAEWVEVLGDDCELPPSVVFQLNLALEEAVVNVIDYAYPGKTDMPVMLTAEDCGDKVIFTLTDNGVPFDPTGAEEPDLTLGVAERPVGGLGIFLVRQIMTDVAYRRTDDSNVLTMVYAKP